MKKSTAQALLLAGTSFFAALGTICGLWYGNLDIISPYDVIRPLVVLLPASVLATLFLFVIHRPLAAILPMAIYLYFSFFDINRIVEQAASRIVSPDSSLPFLVTGFLVLCILFAFYMSWRYVNQLTICLYMFVVIAAATTIILTMIAPSFAVFFSTPPQIDPYFERETLAAVTSYKLQSNDLPDIIYVIPDRYANQRTLRTEFGYDNRTFYAELRRRGFVVFEDSWANYPKTFQSLASTFNSGYLENFKDMYGVNSWHKQPVYKTIENNAVQDRLRKLGYAFYNFGNWWEPTRTNRWADINYQGYPGDSLLNYLTEFEKTLWQRTPTSVIFPLSGSDECKRIKRKLRRLQEIGNDTRPVFVLAHFAIPHAPVYIDDVGQCLARPVAYPGNGRTTWTEFKSAYVKYLRYFNAAILEAIDRQLKRRESKGRALLFVIQSDEGPFPKSMLEANKQFSFSTMSRQELAMKTGIINAFLLPNKPDKEIPKLRTPINNWRIIFNTLTGSDMSLLSDKVFIFPSEKNIFDFCEITDFVMTPSAAVPSCLR